MDQIQDQNVQIAAQNFLASMENYYAMIGQLEAAIASPHSASLGPMGDDDPCWFFVANGDYVGYENCVRRVLIGRIASVIGDASDSEYWNQASTEELRKILQSVFDERKELVNNILLLHKSVASIRPTVENPFFVAVIPLGDTFELSDILTQLSNEIDAINFAYLGALFLKKLYRIEDILKRAKSFFEKLIDDTHLSPQELVLDALGVSSEHQSILQKLRAIWGVTIDKNEWRIMNLKQLHNALLEAEISRNMLIYRITELAQIANIVSDGGFVPTSKDDLIRLGTYDIPWLEAHKAMLEQVIAINGYPTAEWIFGDETALSFSLKALKVEFEVFISFLSILGIVWEPADWASVFIEWRRTGKISGIMVMALTPLVAFALLKFLDDFDRNDISHVNDLIVGINNPTIIEKAADASSDGRQLISYLEELNTPAIKILINNGEDFEKIVEFVGYRLSLSADDVSKLDNLLQAGHVTKVDDLLALSNNSELLNWLYDNRNDAALFERIRQIQNADFVSAASLARQTRKFKPDEVEGIAILPDFPQNVNFSQEVADLSTLTPQAQAQYNARFNQVPYNTVWLEEGNPSAGLRHILYGRGTPESMGHLSDFSTWGLDTDDEIAAYIMDTISGKNGTLKSVGRRWNENARIPQWEYNHIYEVMINGEILTLRVAIGDNGFIVSAYLVH